MNINCATCLDSYPTHVHISNQIGQIIRNANVANVHGAT